MSTAETAYENHLRENWDKLSPFQQEEGRAYLQAKFQSASQAATKDNKPGWTVSVGYVCAVLFGIVGVGFGIYNTATGRAGHGITQVVLSVVIMALFVGAM